MKSLAVLSSVIIIFLSCSAIADSWAEKIQLGGDFRYRTQIVEDEGGNDSASDGSNIQQRLRARLKMKAKVNDRADVILRLTTGSGSATSTNQTLEGGAKNKNFELDQAFVRYELREKTNLYLGKMSNPLVRPGGSGLVFDGDLTPEGAAIDWECDCDKGNAFLKLAHFWVDELDASAGDSQSQDIYQYSTQLGKAFKMGEGQALTFGLGYHFFNTGNATSPALSFKGNTSLGNAYVYNYAITQVFLIYDVQLETPVELFVNAAQNGETSENAKAYSVGLNYGKLKEKGDCSAGLAFNHIEADSVFSAFNDSDFNSGNSNGEGYVLKLGSQFSENSQVNLAYYLAEEIKGPSTDHKIAQLDLSFKF